MKALNMENVRYTTADIYALPDKQRAELIDGEIYMMAPPKTVHQQILTEILVRIRNYIGEKGGDCRVFPSPFGVFLFDDEYNFVEPDISVICDSSKLKEDGYHGAPDWIIEIISPSSRKMECFIKLNSYKKAGVREYWIVDPETDTVRVCDLTGGKDISFGFDDEVKSGIYHDLIIDFSEISALI